MSDKTNTIHTSKSFNVTFTQDTWMQHLYKTSECNIHTRSEIYNSGGRWSVNWPNEGQDS